MDDNDETVVLSPEHANVRDTLAAALEVLTGVRPRVDIMPLATLADFVLRRCNEVMADRAETVRLDRADLAWLVGLLGNVPLRTFAPSDLERLARLSRQALPPAPLDRLAAENGG